MKTILKTSRLRLRTWQTTDIPKMAELSSDKEVMRYFPSTQTYEETEKFVQHNLDHYKAHDFCLYAIDLIHTGDFMGFVGLNVPWFTIPNFQSKNNPVVEIGWRIDKKYWGNGYATEAAKAVLNYAFEKLKLEEIISFTAEINLPSRRVMEKIGLKHDPKDDFNHPKLEPSSPLYHHVLYKICLKEYLQKKSEP